MNHPCLLAAIVMLLASAGQSKIVSATLEYSADDTVAIYLNGELLLDRSPNAWDHYRVLSTSDGTLDLSSLNFGGDNLLAVESFDTAGLAIACSYLLTIRDHRGIAYFVAGDPSNTRLFHLPSRLRVPQASPLGWRLAAFDDSQWKGLVEVPFSPTIEDSNIAQLPFPSIGIGASGGSIPRLSSHVFGLCEWADKNLLRTRFRLPLSLDAPVIHAHSRKVSGTAQIGATILAGMDVGLIGRGKLSLVIPAGFNPIGMSQGGTWESSAHRVTWNLGGIKPKRNYHRLKLSKVVDAKGWQDPEYILNRAPLVIGEKHIYLPKPCASFPPERPGWFQVESTPKEFTERFTEIKGLLFRFTVRLLSKYRGLFKAEPLLLNLGLNGKLEGTLQADAEIRHGKNWPIWGEAYYDASGDRAWIWADLKDLTVKLSTRKEERPYHIVEIAGAEAWVYCEEKAKPVWAWIAPKGRPGQNATLKAELIPESGTPTASAPVSVPIIP